MMNGQKAMLSAHFECLEEEKMKRSIAMLLVFVLLTAMFPAVSAATAEEQPMMLSKDTSALSIDTAQVMENAVRPYGAWAPAASCRILVCTA